MKKILITILTSLTLTGVSYAGSFGIGASGSLAKISADGKEVTGAGTIAGGAANTNTKSVDELTMLGSIFLDFEFENGITFGISHIPGSADVSDKTHSRTDVSQGTTGTDTTGTVTRTAAAEVENFNTVYVEYPVGMFYAKLGFAQLDVITKEGAVTSGGTYGNKTLDGVALGVGANGSLGNFFTKTSVEYTDFEDLSLSSSTNNTISADLDVLEFKFSVGKRF